MYDYHLVAQAMLAKGDQIGPVQAETLARAASMASEGFVT